MNSRIKSLMVMAMMMGAMYNPEEFSGSRNETKIPERKKCFRPGCENFRNGNQLYCSAECCKADKQRVKELNNPKKNKPKYYIGCDVALEGSEFSSLVVFKQKGEQLHFCDQVTESDPDIFETKCEEMLKKYPSTEKVWGNKMFINPDKYKKLRKLFEDGKIEIHKEHGFQFKSDKCVEVIKNLDKL